MADCKIRGVLAIIGGCFVMTSFGTIYSYGNIAPYLTSYIRERSKPASLRMEDSATIFAVGMATIVLIVPIGGIFHSKIGYRPTVILGGSLVSAGVMLTYLATKSSFYVVLITYGFVFPAGIGFAYMSSVVCRMKWFPKYTGRVSGIVMSGFGGGSVIFDQIQTAYINPLNLSPNTSLSDNSDERYFDDDDILDRVPSSFLALGTIYLVMIFAGMLLLFDPPEDGTVENKEIEQEMELLVKQNGDIGFEEKVEKKDNQADVHPRDIIKKASFWNHWGTFFCCGFAIIFIPSLYKAYGQTFILDDRFLTTVGAVGAIFNAGGRILWGIIADAYSYKTAMLAMCASYTVLILTILTTPYGGKIMYFVWICALFSLIGGTFTLIATAAAWTYGTKYVGINFGLLMSGLIVVCPIGIVLPKALQDVAGWNGLFITVACFCALGFLITFKFNERRANGDIV